MTWRAVLLGLALLAGCATPEPITAPPPPVARPAVPENLRHCQPPVPPPPTLGPVKTDASVNRYAWAEAEARWRTAERLTQCGNRIERLNRWIDDNWPGPPPRSATPN